MHENIGFRNHLVIADSRKIIIIFLVSVANKTEPELSISHDPPIITYITTVKISHDPPIITYITTVKISHDPPIITYITTVKGNSTSLTLGYKSPYGCEAFISYSDVFTYSLILIRLIIFILYHHP